MRLPKAEKLPSGNWRVRLQVGKERKSFTAPTKKEALDKAKKFYAGIETEKRIPLTVGKAIDRYIEEKGKVLSPSTIQGYKTIRKNYLQSLMDINISDLKQSDIQVAVGDDAVDGKSPKTIRNAHGLLAAVLDLYRPEFVLKTRLPQKKKYTARIPSEEEMQKILAALKGDPYELPILLAIWLGLRMSEVRGLRYRDICDGRVHIHTAIVTGPDGDVEKGTKTVAGDRWIKLPKEIEQLIDKDKIKAKSDEFIVKAAHNTIYKNFVRVCETAGVKPCRFHDLRHFAASESLALGVPDKYSMKRMGHQTDNMLKMVYQHTLESKEDEFSDLIDKKMRELYNRGHESGHEK